MNKKARSVIIAMDVVGFLILVIGGALIRYSKDEILSVIGGLVLAAGVAVLSISRLVSK